MKQTSGLDALLEALKQSGMNVDDSFGGSSSNEGSRQSASGGSDAGSSSGRRSGSRGGFGGFGGFPGFGGFGGGGGQDGSGPEIHNPFEGANMPKLGKKAIIISVILLIIVLFYRSAKQNNDKAFRWMWLTIVLSFGFYVPVVLWADVNPMIGMLMIPKTCAYVWTVLIGYNAMKTETVKQN